MNIFFRNVVQSGAWLVIFEAKVLQYCSGYGMHWGGRRIRHSAMELSPATEYVFPSRPSIFILTPLLGIPGSTQLPRGTGRQPVSQSPRPTPE
jgi:hypothetical protein